jgi:sugar lactone lactonase YvrE
VKAGAGSAQLKEILIPGEDWKLVGEGYKFTEGPATDGTGVVYFNDVGDSKTYKIVDGKPEVWRKDSKRADGQRFGPDGTMFAASGAENKIHKVDGAGEVTEWASGFRGNDLVVLNNEAIYATDPFETPGNSKVYYVSPKGEKKVVDTGLKFANGITVSPDQTLLYVADSRTHWVYSYQIQADGALAASSDEDAASMAGDDEALVTQDAERLLHGHAGHAVALGEFVARGELVTGCELLGEDRGTEGVGDLHVGGSGVVWVESHSDSLTGSRLGKLDLY